MNLINDPWIPVIHEDGQRGKIAPWQLTDTENPVVELAAPRPDFQGALYQFLIGLLQTTFVPEDEGEWLGPVNTNKRVRNQSKLDEKLKNDIQLVKT